MLAWKEAAKADKRIGGAARGSTDGVVASIAKRVVWKAPFHCGRCRGLRYRIELRDGGRG